MCAAGRDTLARPSPSLRHTWSARWVFPITQSGHPRPLGGPTALRVLGCVLIIRVLASMALYFFHFSRRNRGQGKLCGIPAHTGARPSMIKPKTNCLAEHVHAELTTARLSVCFLLLPFFFQSLCYVTVSQPLVAGQERENRHEPQGGGALRELEHSRVCQLRVRALPRRSFLQTKRTSAASSLVPWPLYLSLFLLSFSRFLPRFFSFSVSPTLSFFAPLLSISLPDPTSHPSISPSTSLSVEREGPPWPPRPSLL